MKKSALDPTQTIILNYFKFVDELEGRLFKINEENTSLRQLMKKMQLRFDRIEDTTILPQQSLLKRMMDQAVRQRGKKSRGFRYDEDLVLEHFCINVLILGGRRLYEVFNANFQGVFPSLTTINKRLSQFNSSADEGSTNIQLVKDYLVANGASLVVSFSEDATGVVGRREYHAKSNSLVGFSLPLGPNGFPDPSLSIARTAHDIVRQFEAYDRARYIRLLSFIYFHSI